MSWTQLVDRKPFPVVVLLTCFIGLSTSGVAAEKKPIVPTVEKLSGRWIGFDCGGRVWRMNLGTTGGGAVAYGTNGGVSVREIQSTTVNGHHRIVVQLRDQGYGTDTLVGVAQVGFLQLDREPSSCSVRFEREDRVEMELAETRRQLERPQP